MSEILIALAALATGVALGLVARSSRRHVPVRADERELLHAADDLEYGLNTVLDFGPLSLSELAAVDLPAKLDRVALTGEVSGAALATLKSCTDRIALHPYPEQRDLLGAVREDEAAVWLALRDAIGSGAAQHVAATRARQVLDEIRGGLRHERGELAKV
ncbi:hypothetical protein FHX81_4856 [Saccharothrix saharensis]|uniref:Uncharacterized protein n=1 Tax=Saccharothrix saharensis TaxID=571190 RepID=A0A543JI79_9PSEU|nr:hypothetical protein [Saccharothrix saharensis]TQM82451.1 hypothetical protein FHX81_4856 [Saccharothrix saharensis]